MKRLLYLLALLAVVFAWRDWTQREIVHPPGVLVTEAPKQLAFVDAQPIQLEAYRLKPRAHFELRARVLSRENYRWSEGADLSPVDLALGWGAMSDQAVLDRIEVSQGGRWYHTRYEYPAPLSDREIIRHSGNMHIIPADALVGKRLQAIRRGDIVHARGYLVDADHESGFRWNTSLSRDDTGNGACELFYVERLEIEN
jgi:hypothetical protein